MLTAKGGALLDIDKCFLQNKAFDDTQRLAMAVSDIWATFSEIREHLFIAQVFTVALKLRCTAAKPADSVSKSFLLSNTGAGLFKVFRNILVLFFKA